MVPRVALIPARNEGPRVGAVVRAALRHAERVVVVVNGCEDDTAARAAEAGAEIIESEPGYTAALAAGYRHLRCALVQLDGDGQHPPEQIPRLALGDDDMVLGSRFLGESGYAVPAGRRLGAAALSGLLQLRTGLRVRDVTSGFMSLSERAVRALAEEPAVTELGALSRARRLGLRVREVPVLMRERSGGLSMHAGPGAAFTAARMALEILREGQAH